MPKALSLFGVCLRLGVMSRCGATTGLGGLRRLWVVFPSDHSRKTCNTLTATLDSGLLLKKQTMSLEFHSNFLAIRGAKSASKIEISINLFLRVAASDFILGILARNLMVQRTMMCEPPVADLAERRKRLKI
ncbi:MAG: hypothetical protein ACRBBV_15545 [Paracoccaceae bacterium]